MLVRVFLGWCVLSAILFSVTNTAAASTAARIVIVTSGNAPLARKVRAEAENAGILVSQDEAATPAGDGALLERYGAVGVVELTSPDRVRIYVAPSGEHGPYQTFVERAPADGDGFALRVVEQVRGRLVELRLLLPEAPSAAVPRTTTQPESPAPPDGIRSPPTLGLAVGGALSVATGGIGPTPGIALGLRLDPSAHLSASLHALLPVVENELNEPEGEASVLVNLFFAELGYRLAPPQASFQPEIGAGAGIVVLPLEGETSEPREAHDDELVAGVYFLGLGAGYSVESWLELRAGLRGGLSAPRPTIVFSDREVASWGRPFFAATLEAEFQVPLSSERAAP